MKINEIIKEKRRELGYTQEQLAKYLNLTTPAVNKWERGISYPDITILPALARVLKTDLNTLLSFKDDLSDYEVTLFLNELAKINDFKQAYHYGIDKINEYPTCYNLILSVASVLSGMLVMNNKPLDSAGYDQEIESLFKRALLSDDPVIVNQARVRLITNHLKRKEFDQAEILINELPNISTVDKNEQLIKLYQAQENFDQAAKLQEEIILNSANKITASLLVLMNIAVGQNRDDDAKAIADIYKNICDSLDLWQYSSHLAHFQLYLSKKNRFKSLKTLAVMLKAVTSKWEINSSPLYRHIQTKEIDSNFYLEMRSNIIDSLKNDQEASFLKEDKFEEMLKEYE